jgi:alpha-L-arabinofuranosidase
MGDSTFVIDVHAPIGTISPRLYGHFAEHLGRCCYDGLFCDSEAGIAVENGFRTDVLAALRDLPVPLLRWPGGCLLRPTPMPSTAWLRLTPWRRLRWLSQEMGKKAGG